MLQCYEKHYLNDLHYFFMKIPNNDELKQIAYNHFSNINLL